MMISESGFIFYLFILLILCIILFTLSFIYALKLCTAQALIYPYNIMTKNNVFNVCD